MGIRIPPTWPLLLTRFSGPYTNFCHLRRRQRAKAVGGGEGLILFIGETQAQQRHIGVKGQGIVQTIADGQPGQHGWRFVYAAGREFATGAQL